MSHVSAEEERREIYIGKPYITCLAEDFFSPFGAELSADIRIGEEWSRLWFRVPGEFGEYLTYERTDAFLVGILPLAMELGYGIRCEAPVTRRLLYQIRHYLIPSLSANLSRFHSVPIEAETEDRPLPCAGAAATGWTGGVDSMYTLMKHINIEEKGRRLTHLLIANNGAIEASDSTKVLRQMMKNASGIAAEMGLSVVGVDTNLQELHPAAYLSVAAYRLPAVALALQKLFGILYNSAGYEFSRFSFQEENSAYYEILPLDCFETDNTVFYSAGGAVPRIRKLEELSEFEPAKKWLHPCIYAMRPNCGHCGKCVRTMTALYALGTLERFGGVFDLQEFYRNKDKYLAEVLCHKNSQHYGEAVALLKKSGELETPKIKRMARIMEAAAEAAQKMEKQKEDGNEGDISGDTCLAGGTVY